MTKRWWDPRRHWAVLTLVAAAAGLVFVAMRPTPVLVDLAVVDRGDIVVSVSDDGRTRVSERFEVHAPVRGRLLRPRLEPGDEVRAGQTVLFELEPADSTPLDERSRLEAEALVERALARRAEAAVAVDRARAELEYARDRLARVRPLAGSGLESADTLAAAERDLSRALTGLRAAEAAEITARIEVEVARARLGAASMELVPDSGPAAPPEAITVRSPIDGVVLEVLVESARPVEAAEPLLVLGDLDGLEVVADFLTEQAVRIRPGQVARVTGWGERDAPALAARVRRVEPAGRTVISALGVEEQRVDVLFDLIDPPEARPPLGDGFHVRCEVVLEQVEDVLRAPLGALLRGVDGQSAYVEVDGVARLRRVRTGRTNATHAEVLEGLEAGERLVLYPSERVEEGQRLRLRDALR